LRQLALETLEKLGWIPSPEDVVVNSSAVDNARVDMPLGDSGRFGPSGDFAQGSRGIKAR